MLDLEGPLTYNCSESRRKVLTGILTDEATLTRLGALKLSVWCPHCATPHMIAAKDAFHFLAKHASGSLSALPA